MSGAVAAMAVAALLVSGCGSSDSKNDNGGKDKGGSSEQPSQDKSGKPPSGGDEKGSLPGVWQTKVGGEKLVLVIAQGKVTLFHGDNKKACTGSALGKPATLTLKCPGGTDEERTNGTVESVRAKTLKVSWNGGASESYTKVADAPKFLPKDPEKLRKMVPAQ